ncbi:enoyl-CoA hydratase/isomerase [Priestia megaterium]|uniref:enoyl-CoA hydratase/isomerase n=1 Tax=Priestia megaterium TaxID=1404 RepID=UPI0012D8C51D|nr:enoyl-CoA hydratase/isomerase [Priestia megaterium]MUL34709.1 putative polyketide biosynthesis enoyl-CoA hydratase PksH [Priestia megaterium]
MNYQTIDVRFQGTICFLRFYRPDANNTINSHFVEECHQVLDLCEKSANIVVLEGLPEVFCFGADFQNLYAKMKSGQHIDETPEPLYELWLKLANGPFITISHVRGKVNAGGVGFVASSDIVIADETAQFSLSELLFGLLPACVLPFLIRRIGFQKANYMTLTTQTISAQQAQTWGLVDVFDRQSEDLLRKYLIRLRYIPKKGIYRYKSYMNSIQDSLVQSKPLAIAANQEVFSDPHNLERIFKYIETGQFPSGN